MTEMTPKCRLSRKKNEKMDIYETSSDKWFFSKPDSKYADHNP